MIVIVDCVDINAKEYGPGNFLVFNRTNKRWTGHIIHLNSDIETNDSIELDPLMDWFLERSNRYEQNS